MLVTTGSQAADLSTGSMMGKPPPPPNSGRSWALWKSLAKQRKEFGNPDAFFGADKVADSALGDIHCHHNREGLPRPG